ncbi:MAG: YbhB/YbcL family Raf kinase inhibitor-like protein [Candidatus Peribacteraceae bacterium]|nr:YbhB/YbcL family Raf kinase inhibitor-like protein [Candidatus Peribacteraceae bacterium]MDD5742717.1 YbhB/YbcL family Raf kinase inhibitor-like protein [Candidatus Peribacteraceae bacterium]
MGKQSIILLSGLTLLLAACAPAEPLSVPPSAMIIKSPAFGEGGTIPVRFTCDGEGVSPPLTFSNVLQNVQSLALVMDDPDAPSGDYVHWVVYNIDPIPLVVPEGTVPSGGKLGVTGSQEARYVPPCPPSGAHRYFFHLYALDTVLSFDAAPSKADLVAAMQGHVLAEAELTGTFGS